MWKTEPSRTTAGTDFPPARSASGIRFFAVPRMDLLDVQALAAERVGPLLLVRILDSVERLRDDVFSGRF